MIGERINICALFFFFFSFFFFHSRQKKTRRGVGGRCLFGIPWRALSSENSRATSSNLVPERNLARASSFFECFSHYVDNNVIFDSKSARALFWGEKEINEDIYNN